MGEKFSLSQLGNAFKMQCIGGNKTSLLIATDKWRSLIRWRKNSRFLLVLTEASHQWIGWTQIGCEAYC